MTGDFNLTSYYAKRIIGDTAAASYASALLQTGEDIQTDTWILHRTNRASLYGIKYGYDSSTNGTADKIELYGGYQESNTYVPSIWAQLDTGDMSILGSVGIGDDPQSNRKLYVDGNVEITGILYVTDGTDADDIDTGAIQVSGGIYIAKDIFSHQNIWAGIEDDSLEHKIGARSNAGTIYFYSQDGTTNNTHRGIYGENTSASGTTIFSIDQNNYIDNITSFVTNLDLKNLNWTKGTAPSTQSYRNINFTSGDSSSNRIAFLEATITTGNNTAVGLYLAPSVANSESYSGIVLTKTVENILSISLAGDTTITGNLKVSGHIYLTTGAKHIYMQYNNTDYNILHNHNNGNISLNAASAGLYMAYQNTTFVNWMNGRMELRDGCLSLFPNNGQYREGIRIHSTGNWSDITLCGNDNTVNSGTSANSWFLGNNNGTFYITKNGSSSSSTGYLKASTVAVSNVDYGYWELYQRVGINGQSTGYNFYVNGNSYITSTLNVGTNLGIAQNDGASGYGISLYAGPNYVKNYGLLFAKTSYLGTHGNVTSDWATYFTMDGNQNRGWIFRHTTAGNVASINAYGYMTLSGNIHISHATNATMTADSTNPKITFSESGTTQPVHLIYTDYDSYRSPAGLKVVGGASATPAWFEVEGQVYAARFNGPLTGNVTGNCSGSSGSCTGNAATATTLQTARTINGTSFNGSANITTNTWGATRKLTIGATGKDVNGSAAVSWSLSEIGIAKTSSGVDINTYYNQYCLYAITGASANSPTNNNTAQNSYSLLVINTGQIAWNGNGLWYRMRNSSGTWSKWYKVTAS